MIKQIIMLKSKSLDIQYEDRIIKHLSELGLTQQIVSYLHIFVDEYFKKEKYYESFDLLIKLQLADIK